MHQHISDTERSERLTDLARELAQMRGTIGELPRLRAIRREYAELIAQEQTDEDR